MALDLDDLVICGVCHQLRDRNPRRPAGTDGRVWCDCQRDQRPSGEAGIDAYELCYCCVAVLLRSGTKWSRFFCEDCHSRAMALNQSVGRCVVPIGRHSMMNGVGYNRTVPSHPSLEAFASELHGFFAGVGGVSEWSRHWLVQTMDAYGLLGPHDVSLRVYLAHATGRDRGVGFSFDEMLEFLAARSLTSN